MLQINLCQPSSIILADLQQRPVFEKFLEAVLLSLGFEFKWEYAYEYDDTGFLRQESRTYSGVREVEPCTAHPPEGERGEQQI